MPCSKSTISSLPDNIFPIENNCTTTTIAPTQYNNILPNCDKIATTEDYIENIYNDNFCNKSTHSLGSSNSIIANLENCYKNQFRKHYIKQPSILTMDLNTPSTRKYPSQYEFVKYKINKELNERINKKEAQHNILRSRQNNIFSELHYSKYNSNGEIDPTWTAVNNYFPIAKNSTIMMSLPIIGRKYTPCFNNINIDTALQPSKLNKIWHQVRMPSSQHTANKAMLNVKISESNKPIKQYDFKLWNQISDRAVPSKSTITTVPRYKMGHRPGGTAPQGTGVDVKHGSYDRYMLKLKGKTRNTINKSNQYTKLSTALYGNKTYSPQISYNPNSSILNSKIHTCGDPITACND